MSRDPESPPAAPIEGTYDLIGVGLGPASLALMIAAEEDARGVHGRPLRCLFVAPEESFCWRTEMVFDEVRAPLTFLEDLVTLRNPQSRYTFLNYVREKGRLDYFANLRKFQPTKSELRDYYAWVAEELGSMARYGCEVTAMRPLAASGGVDLLEVTIREAATGVLHTCQARNLLLDGEGEPRLPAGVDQAASGRVFHSRDLLCRLEEGFADREAPYRFVVVGSGQSSAEVFHHLCEHYPAADVTAAIGGFSYQPADPGHVVDEIFLPQMAALFDALPEERRQRLLRAQRNASGNAVEASLVQAISKLLYDQKAKGLERARVRPFLELEAVAESGDGASARFRDLLQDTEVSLSADAVVLATGFRLPEHHPLLEALSEHLERDRATGGFRVESYHRLAVREGFRPGLFLGGYLEQAFGFQDSLLTTLPYRSAHVLQALELGADREAAEVREVMV